MTSLEQTIQKQAQKKIGKTTKLKNSRNIGMSLTDTNFYIAGGVAAAAAVSFAALVFRTIKKAKKTSHSVRLKCACGNVEADCAFNPNPPGNLLCYCTDCRRFADTLKAKQQDFIQRRPDETRGWRNLGFLNDNGGTKMVQVYRAHVKLLSGQDSLKVCKLTKKSDLSRVYCKVCYTPIFNIFGEAFATTIPVMTVFDELVVQGKGNPASTQHPFGPKKKHLFTIEATGKVKDVPSTDRVYSKVSFAVTGKLVWHMVAGLLAGMGNPSPMSNVVDKDVEIWEDSLKKEN